MLANAILPMNASTSCKTFVNLIRILTPSRFNILGGLYVKTYVKICYIKNKLLVKEWTQRVTKFPCMSFTFLHFNKKNVKLWFLFLPWSVSAESRFNLSFRFLKFCKKKLEQTWKYNPLLLQNYKVCKQMLTLTQMSLNVNVWHCATV